MTSIHITRESGTVAAIEERPGGRVALVAMDPPQGGEEECATCRMCFKKGNCERVLPAAIDTGEAEVLEGVRVEVEIAHPSLYLPILVTLLLPLVGLVAGGLLGLALGAGRDSQDLICALLSIVGAAAFFILGRLLFRKNIKSQKPTARVYRVL